MRASTCLHAIACLAALLVRETPLDLSVPTCFSEIAISFSQARLCATHMVLCLASFPIADIGSWLWLPSPWLVAG
jgi:hypothetical protein